MSICGCWTAGEYEELDSVQENGGGLGPERYIRFWCQTTAIGKRPKEREMKEEVGEGNKLKQDLRSGGIAHLDVSWKGRGTRLKVMGNRLILNAFFGQSRVWDWSMVCGTRQLSTNG